MTVWYGNDELEGRKWSWPNFKVLSWHLPGGTEENHINLSQDSGSLSQDLNPGPPEYEAGVLNHLTTTFGDTPYWLMKPKGDRDRGNWSWWRNRINWEGAQNRQLEMKSSLSFCCSCFLPCCICGRYSGHFLLLSSVLFLSLLCTCRDNTFNASEPKFN
jgi:hypothetical protein